MLGCKAETHFLRAPLVPVERQAPSTPMDVPWATDCWPEAPCGGEGGVVGVLGPAESWVRGSSAVAKRLQGRRGGTAAAVAEASVNLECGTHSQAPETGRPLGSAVLRPGDVRPLRQGRPRQVIVPHGGVLGGLLRGAGLQHHGPAQGVP